MIDHMIANNCTGCEACCSRCPKSCISMVEDKEGFYFPKVDYKLCLNSKKCAEICPILNFKNNHKNISDLKLSFAYRSNNDAYRKNCSSGAVFMDLAVEFINVGGVVYGASFNTEYKLYHKKAENIAELKPLTGSKYLQGRIGDIYKEVKYDLDSGRKVAFFGLTCQIEGLHSYLNKSYSNLYSIDLICMGIPSPMVWKKYLDSYYNVCEITSINFKDKRLGWHKFSLTINHDDGKSISIPGFDDKYMECMFKGYSLRKSCFSCPYKCENKISDITIADCWGCENYVADMDDNKGLSMIIVHSIKGSKLVESLNQKGELRQFNYQNVLKYNSHYYKCAIKKKGRTFFYFLLKLSPKSAFYLMGKNPNKSMVLRVKNKIKKIFRSIL